MRGEGIEINLTFSVSISSTSNKFNKSGIWELQLFLNDKSLVNMNVYVTKENGARQSRFKSSTN